MDDFSKKFLLILLLIALPCVPAVADGEFPGGVGLLKFLGGLPSTYSAKPIKGWMVDTETKKPLQNVIVVALWELEENQFHGPRFVTNMKVMETVTDSQGRYNFPGWGPIKRPGKASLRTSDPMLIYFKEGYRPKTATNWGGASLADNRYEAVHDSIWSGKEIELEKFKGDIKEYAKLVDNVYSNLFNLKEDGCKWQEAPRIFFFIDKYNRLLHPQNQYNQGIFPTLFRSGNRGDMEEYLRNHKP